MRLCIAAGAVWECPLLAELNPLPAGGATLGSSAHDRVALGMRRSYTQLSAGGNNSTLSTILGSPPDHQQQHTLLGRPGDKQQQQQQHTHPHQQADKQQQQASAAADDANGGLHHQQQHQQQLGRRNSSSGGVGPTWAGPLIQGAPYAVCQSGAKFPAYVGSNVQCSSFDERYTHFYSISPDACTNPTIYWLGR